LNHSLLEILFILLFFILLNLLCFIKNRKAVLLLLSLIPVFLITGASILKLRYLTGTLPELLIFSGLIIFPYTFVYMTLQEYPVDYRGFFLKSVILSVPILVLFVIIPERRYPLICLLHMALYTQLLITLKTKLFVKLHLTFIMIAPLIYLFFHYLFIRDDSLLIFAINFTYIINFFIILFEYSLRLDTVQERMQALIKTNTKLNQGITRLRQNNEQLKSIISQKDIELLQIARHASLAEVTTGIAHELAQPLTGIKCISQSMIDDINYDELDRMQAVADLAKISSLVDRSSSIIDHIRTFSRKRGFSFQQIDLNSCILRAIDLINNQIKRGDIDIVFDLNDSIPLIKGDNLSLEQLFINLILNSRDAIEAKKEADNSRQGLIKVITGHSGNDVILEIEDNGCGIPQEILSRIWTPFFTTKQKGKGTGIGLSLSHRIIKEHRAEISIDTSEKGTKFRIVFASADDPEKLNN